jgi:hypothetical protein
MAQLFDCVKGMSTSECTRRPLEVRDLRQEYEVAFHHLSCTPMSRIDSHCRMRQIVVVVHASSMNVSLRL